MSDKSNTACPPDFYLIRTVSLVLSGFLLGTSVGDGLMPDTQAWLYLGGSAGLIGCLMLVVTTRSYRKTVERRETAEKTGRMEERLQRHICESEQPPRRHEHKPNAFRDRTPLHCPMLGDD